MQLGAFSLSLAVSNLAASRAFYKKLGFTVFGGSQADRWLVMKNGATLIGLFEGMLKKNMLTFNPGWDADAQPLREYDDVRVIQKHLREQGLLLDHEADETTQGPEYLLLRDPDGNPILIDQHV